MLAVAVALLLQQQAMAGSMECAGDLRKPNEPADTRCEPRPEPDVQAESYHDDVGQSRVPPRSPDLGAAFDPLSPSIGPGSGKLGPEAGRGVLQPDPYSGRDKPSKKRRPRQESESPRGR